MAGKKPAVALNLGLLGEVLSAADSVEEQRARKIDAFMSDDGEIILMNVLLEKVRLSFLPSLPKERGEGNKDNPDYKQTGWTATAIADALPEEWRAILTAGDVEKRLHQWHDDQAGMKPEEKVLTFSKVARFETFGLNIDALRKMVEAEENAPEPETEKNGEEEEHPPAEEEAAVARSAGRKK